RQRVDDPPPQQKSPSHSRPSRERACLQCLRRSPESTFAAGELPFTAGHISPKSLVVYVNDKLSYHEMAQAITNNETDSWVPQAFPLAASSNLALLMAVALYGDEGHLLQVGVMLLFVRAALRRRNLLDGGSRRQLTWEILHIHVVEAPQVGQIIEVKIRGYDLAEIHTGFLKIIQKVAHRLAELEACCTTVDSSVRSGDKAALRRTIERIAGEDAGASRRAGRHILRTDGSPLFQIADGHARELDSRTARQARDLDGRPSWRIAELEAAGIMLVHDAHRKLRGQVGINEDHVSRVQPGRLEDYFHAVECEVHLGGGIFRSLALGRVATRHSRNKQPIVSENSGRKRFV